MTEMWEIQEVAVGLLEAVTEFADIGDAILADDGSYPETAGRENALRTLGVSIVVSIIGEPSPDLLDQALDGTAAISHPITVWLDVRSTDTFSLDTLQAEAAKFIYYIEVALSGKPNAESANHLVFQLKTPPYLPAGKFGGDIRYGIFFWVNSIVTPS